MPAKRSVVVSTTEWLPWLQTNWKESGYERFVLLLETNCIRQPKGQLPTSSYNHNTVKSLITCASPTCLKCTCNDSFTDVGGLSVYCGCEMNWAAAYWVALWN